MDQAVYKQTALSRIIGESVPLIQHWIDRDKLGFTRQGQLLTGKQVIAAILYSATREHCKEDLRAAVDAIAEAVEAGLPVPEVLQFSAYQILTASVFNRVLDDAIFHARRSTGQKLYPAIVELADLLKQITNKKGA